MFPLLGNIYVSDAWLKAIKQCVLDVSTSYIADDRIQFPNNNALLKWAINSPAGNDLHIETFPWIMVA